MNCDSRQTNFYYDEEREKTSTSIHNVHFFAVVSCIWQLANLCVSDETFWIYLWHSDVSQSPSRRIPLLNDELLPRCHINARHFARSYTLSPVCSCQALLRRISHHFSFRFPSNSSCDRNRIILQSLCNYVYLVLFFLFFLHLLSIGLEGHIHLI